MIVGPVSHRFGSDGIEYVTSSPIPVHTARIARTLSGTYVVRLVSVAPFPELIGRYGDVEQARIGASRAVNARTVSDMRAVFNGPQRFAMGQQQCPYLRMGRLCKSPATVGTVWCEWHPNGRNKDVGQ